MLSTKTYETGNARKACLKIEAAWAFSPCLEPTQLFIRHTYKNPTNNKRLSFAPGKYSMALTSMNLLY